jgi:hypothetical protein
VVVPELPARRTEDMGTSQLRKVETGFMVKIVSLEQRAEIVREDKEKFVVEGLFVALKEVGVDEVRLKAGLDWLARSV